MELKNLLTKLKHKEEIPEHFFALEISDDVIKSAVWTVVDGHTKVVKIGSSESWNGQNPDSLLKAVDQSISHASENILPEPSGVVFGLPESWLDKQGINADKKQLLKKLCQELELKPLGYVVTDTAVIQYLKIEEGTPPSAIFLQISSGELNLTLVKLGKILGTHLVGRSEDLGADVEEALSRFDKVDTLPARMILYNSKQDFEENKQQLMSYDWEEKLPFIHFPKVEVLSEETSIKAVALAGGSEVAKSLGFAIKPPKKKEPEPEKESKAITAESLGFVAGKDIAKLKSTAVPLTAEPTPSSAEPERLAETEPKETVEPQSTESKLLAGQLQFTLQSIKQRFKPGLTKLKSFLQLKGKDRPQKLTLIAVGFGIILIAIFAAYWYLPKAKVTIFVEPKTVDEDLTLTIDPKASILNSEDGILPGNSVEISVEGSKSVPTTGTSLIGDPAQGDVTVYNKTNAPKTFDAGIILIGPANLAFTLDEDVTVASRSSQKIEGGEETIWGKANTKITAKSIGPEGNLSGGSQLSFQKFSEDDYSAKVIDGLSGGTAREVKAVSQEDQDNLLEDLTSQLKTQAAEDLKSQLGEGMSLVDVEDQDELISKSFNHQVDEEADSLKLDAKLEYSALSYRQSDLDLLLQQTIKEKIPDNFQLSQSSEIEIEPAELEKDGTAVVEVIFKAKLIPKLDFSEIKKNLKGRYPHITQEYLATLPNFVKADIIITPNLPQKLKTLPRIAKNITLEVKAED
jgi:hypothetical protein